MKTHLKAFPATGSGGWLTGAMGYERDYDFVCDDACLAEDGKPDVEKMKLITYDPVHHGYVALGSRVGNAFHDGQALK